MQPNFHGHMWVQLVCAASSVHRRVGGGIGGIDPGKGEPERKSGVKCGSWDFQKVV